MKRFLNNVVPLFFFLLPWQTIWIFRTNEIVGHASPFAVLGVYGAEILVLLIALVASGGFRIHRDARRPLLATGLLMLVVACSFIFSTDHAVSVAHVIHLLFAGLLFVALLDRRISMERAMVGFVAGLTIPSLIGIVQFFVGTFPASTLLGLSSRDAAIAGEAVIQSDGQRYLRAYGSFAHPNIFGGYLAVGLVSIWGLWGLAKKKWQIIALGIVGFLMSFALVLTFSRSAWLGLVLAAIVSAMVMKLSNTDVARNLVIPVAIVFIAAAMVLSLGLGVNLRPGSDAEFEQTSVDERVVQYNEFQDVLGRRWLVGYGPGTYPWATASVFPDREWWQYQPMHNVLLLVIAELGIIGFMAVIAWSSSIDKLNFSRFPHEDAVVAFAMGNVILVILFFDHYLWSSWAGLALVAYVMAMTVRLGED